MPLFWLSIAFLGGLFLAAYLPAHWAVWAGVAALALGMGIFESRLFPASPFIQRVRAITRLPLGLIVAAFFAGALRTQLAQPSFSAADLAWYNDQGDVRLVGVIATQPEVNAETGLTRIHVEISEYTALDAEGDVTPSIPVTGSLVASSPTREDWQYGDKIELVGILSTPREDVEFSYREYLAQRGIYSQMDYPHLALLERGQGNPLQAALYHLQSAARQFLLGSLPRSEAALLSGILLGLDNDISPDLYAAFRATGTAHIIAISGFNIAILAGLFAALSGRIISNRWTALFFAVLGVVFYTLLVGGNPSVVRAAIMGGMGLLGHQLGRRQAGANSLAFTAAAMCLFNPFLPWDASFQLSFAATLGLVLYAERMQNWFISLLERKMDSEKARRLAGPVGEFFLFTLAAQVTTLPVMVAQFQRFSLSALLANPLVLPAQSLLMILGGLAVLVGLIFQPLGQFLVYLAWPLAAYTNRMAELLARLPGEISIGKTGVWFALVFYLLLFSLTLWRSRLNLANVRRVFGAFRRVAAPAGLLIFVGLLAAVTWRIAITTPDGNLHLAILENKQGMEILLTFPGGQQALLNSGSSTPALVDFLTPRLPVIGRHLDWVLLAAPAKEELAALISQFPPRQALLRAAELTDPKKGWLLETLSTQGTIIHSLEEGQFLVSNEGVRLAFRDFPGAGSAFLLEWGNFRGVINYGIPPEIFNQDFPGWTTGMSLLVLGGEPGSGQTQAGWETAVARVVISRQADNPRWIDLNQHGWVHLSTDGNQMWVETER